VSGHGKAKMALVVIFLVFLTGGHSTLAQDKADDSIHIDIPVKLEKANVLFDIGHPSFVGDMPVGMRYMDLLANRLKETGGSGNIIGVFYGDATYMVLNDKAYNTFRNVSTGNPYKEMIATLVKENVQVEVCAVAMKMHHWTNADLLPDVKVNSGAIGRIVQLVQQGYVPIRP
jgi:intracellular sulfur oxidation DsrE/DsrF family protein